MILENGCFFISDSTRIFQTIEVIRSLRILGFNGKCGVLLVDELLKNEYSTLAKLNTKYVIPKISKVWPPPFSRSGLKLWIPFYFKCKSYIVMDSDIIVINLDFIENFQRVPLKFKIVGESDIFWQPDRKGINSYHKAIFGKRVLQTGILGFTKAAWCRFFPQILSIMKEDPSDYGDMVAINLYLYSHSSEMLILGEENCLVLRSSSKGIGTQNHLLFVCLKNGKLFYKGKEISTVHYTRSDGKITKLGELTRGLSLRDKAIG